MALTDQIQSDMVAAMRQQDSLRLATLRMVKTALQNKRIEKSEDLSGEEERAILKTLVKQRRDSASQFRKGDREELALKEEQEMAVIEAYLPAPASEDEVRAAIAAAIEETGATTPQDMGRVMKAAMARLAGKTADGASVSRMVKETLAG